ncbi:MAG: polysaccharide biosynthesis/export family protein [Myxococcota bacterium]|nr:polysaccharide biosynthesis/export family protein [Myxococcota bacterium]
MSLRFMIASATLAAWLSACGPPASSARPPAPSHDDTSLGAGDMFDIRVYGEEDLSNNYRVAQDGTIDFPYVGRVVVAELEPTEVADLLEQRLQTGGVLVRPQVSVLVTEYASKRISVSGAVNSPGNYPINPGLTALQAVGLAGGTTELANRNGAILTRRVEGSLRRYSLPLEQITLGASEDIPVRAGDIIFVPERIF